MQQSLVTVVVISYNSRDTILETLESVKAQTYENLELVVADDASKDDTVAIVEKWIQENEDKFTRTKLIANEKNKGIPGNLNGALPEVQGEYVKFLAADDILMPEAIQSYSEFCIENFQLLPIAKVDLLCQESCEISDIQSIENYCNRCYDFARLDYKKQYKALLRQNCILSPAADFLPTQLVRQVGGFDKRYPMMEDYPFYIQIMKKGYGFGLLDKKNVKYRISTGSVSNASSEKLRKAEKQLFFQVRFKEMIKKGMFREALGQLKYWIQR